MNFKTAIIKHLGLILFLMSLLTGLLTFDKYGIGWDEDYQRQIGEVNYNHAFHGDQKIQTFPGNDHGASFELLLILLEKGMGLDDSREIYLMRHLVSHILFLIAALCCFFLVDLLFSNKWLAAAGFLMLVLNPQLYGQSFFNSKDVPFLSLLMISFYLTAIAFRSKRLIHFVTLGICCGLFLGIRIMGILPIACLTLFFIPEFFICFKKRSGLMKIMASLLVFLGSTILVLYISWPYLYQEPVQKLTQVFEQMSHYQWIGQVLFFGEMVMSPDLPWYYAPAWFLIGNPLVWLFMGISGILFLCIRFFRDPLLFLYDAEKRNFPLYLICFGAPVLSVIVLQSILYDGWRHLFFIYPAFVMLAVFGLNEWMQTRLKKSAILLMIAGICSTGGFMAYYFPHFHVFINSLVWNREPEFLRNNFEMDYWGVSNKQGLEYILAHDSDSIINICTAGMPGRFNRFLLTPEQRSRIRYRDCDEETEYFITFYRWHPGNYEFSENQNFYSIKVMNSSILTVFKLRDIPAKP